MRLKHESKYALLTREGGEIPLWLSHIGSAVRRSE